MNQKINKNDYPLFDNDNRQQEVYEHFERQDDLERAAKELEWLLKHEKGEREGS